MPLHIYPVCIHKLRSKITTKCQTPAMQSYPNSTQCNAILDAPANRVTLLEHSHPPCKPHSYSTRWDLNRQAGLDLVLSIPSIRKNEISNGRKGRTYVCARNRRSSNSRECADEHHGNRQETRCRDPHLRFSDDPK